MHTMYRFIKNNLSENRKGWFRKLKIKPPIVKYIGVGIPARSVMAEETTNNLLNFDIEVNIWTHLKANNKLNL